MIRVCVVDDQTLVRQGIRSLLALDPEIEVVGEAADGEEALQMVREQHPDAVVLDLLMPKMTGFDVLREIRQDDRVKATPVLAMSGVYKDVILGFLQELGAHGFLDKGQIEDSLVFRIQGLLDPRSGAIA